MKKEWLCTWQLIPESQKHTEKFASEKEAKKAMAQRIAEHFDYKPYLSKMRNSQNEDYQEVADYLEAFLACLSFSECEEKDFPGLSGLVDCYMSGEELYWSYEYLHCPSFSARESCYDAEPGFFVGFCFQRPAKAPSGINIHIVEHYDYGNSANPLLVWKALGSTPKTQKQLARLIYQNWGAEIDRKAVGRHLQLLQNLGFPVKCCLDGYFLEGEPSTPRTDIPYSPSAYPLLILQTLKETPRQEKKSFRQYR